jgi:hypothetical protein
MIAVRQDATVYVSTDIARAMTGLLQTPAYRVVFHAMPGIAIAIEAPTIDAAQARAVTLVRSERALPQTGATITAIDPRGEA